MYLSKGNIICVEEVLRSYMFRLYLYTNKFIDWEVCSYNLIFGKNEWW